MLVKFNVKSLLKERFHAFPKLFVSQWKNDSKPVSNSYSPQGVKVGGKGKFKKQRGQKKKKKEADT